LGLFRDALAARDLSRAASSLLTYYDRTYERGIEGRAEASRTVQLPPGSSAAQWAAAVEAALD
jgi:hypothetical protein